MILQELPDGSLKNMHVAHYPELTLLFADIKFPEDQNPEEVNSGQT